MLSYISVSVSVSVFDLMRKAYWAAAAAVNHIFMDFKLSNSPNELNSVARNVCLRSRISYSVNGMIKVLSVYSAAVSNDM